MKIYTKTGDCGQTSLIGGRRVSKSDLRLEAYGTLDELNANLALLREHLSTEAGKEHIIDIQKHLFRLGAQLATPPDATNPKILENCQRVTEITESMTEELENEIDLVEASLPVQHSFILPGGNEATAVCHICRTVCRRAERCCVALNEVSPVDAALLRYLNRLSDYLFVLSRKLCLKESEEMFWDGI